MATARWSSAALALVCGCAGAPEDALEFGAAIEQEDQDEGGDEHDIPEPTGGPSSGPDLPREPGDWTAGHSDIRLVAELPVQDAPVAVAIVDLASGELPLHPPRQAVVSVHPDRGQVDLTLRDDDGQWAIVGSFFAGGRVVEVQPVTLQAQRTIVARTDDRRVFLLPLHPQDETRFDYWVRVAQHNDSITGLEVTDVDGDGNDDLVYTHPKGTIVARGVEKGLGTNPEAPPSLARDTVLGGVTPTAMTVRADEGTVEILAVDGETGLLWSTVRERNAGGRWSEGALVPTIDRWVSARPSDCAGIRMFGRTLEHGFSALDDDDTFVPWPAPVVLSSRGPTTLLRDRNGALGLATECLAPLAPPLSLRPAPTQPVTMGCVEDELHAVVADGPLLRIYDVAVDAC